MTEHRTEIWLVADTTEEPIAYPLSTTATDALEVETTGASATLRLELKMSEARLWAAELFSAVSIAYREATWDPHALSDEEIASLSASIGPRHKRPLRRPRASQGAL